VERLCLAVAKCNLVSHPTANTLNLTLRASRAPIPTATMRLRCDNAPAAAASKRINVRK
jgi:hypothetical protein